MVLRFSPLNTGTDCLHYFAEVSGAFIHWKALFYLLIPGHFSFHFTDNKQWALYLKLMGTNSSLLRVRTGVADSIYCQSRKWQNQTAEMIPCPLCSPLQNNRLQYVAGNNPSFYEKVVCTWQQWCPHWPPDDFPPSLLCQECCWNDDKAFNSLPWLSSLHDDLLEQLQVFLLQGVFSYSCLHLWINLGPSNDWWAKPRTYFTAFACYGSGNNFFHNSRGKEESEAPTLLRPCTAGTHIQAAQDAL